MDETYTQDLERSQVRGQAITYFGIALLLMISIGKDLKFINTSVGLYINTWPLLIIDLIILGLSLFFIASLFINLWLPLALKVIKILKFPTLALLPMTFFVGAVNGLIQLSNLANPLFGAYSWSAILILFALEAHLIIEAFGNGKQSKQKQLQNRWITYFKTIFQLNILKRKSCLDCGYLCLEHWEARGLPEEQSFYQQLRNDWKDANNTQGLQILRCFRRLWDNTLRHIPDEQIKRVKKPRVCPRFFPYSGGSLSEHMESHRARTQRRWVVAGALIGP